MLAQLAVGFSYIDPLPRFRYTRLYSVPVDLLKVSPVFVCGILRNLGYFDWPYYVPRRELDSRASASGARSAAWRPRRPVRAPVRGRRDPRPGTSVSIERSVPAASGSAHATVAPSRQHRDERRSEVAVLYTWAQNQCAVPIHRVPNRYTLWLIQSRIHVCKVDTNFRSKPSLSIVVGGTAQLVCSAV